ncbi:MAG: TIGR02147 family protein [SAR324 cluster bacterium]|nr:TIGR02147 family protein [SAR324 cluster bacterium]
MAQNSSDKNNDPGRRYRKIRDFGFSEVELNIYNFVEFKTLLKAYFNACKEKDRRYSLRYFSYRFGSKNPSFIKAILDGRQKISEELFTEFTELLMLDGDQFDYFESLFRLDQCPEGTALHKKYYERFRNLRFRKPVSLVDAQYDCITSWFTWLIRETASLKGAHYNPLWFKKCLNPLLDKNIPEIVEALESLKQVKLLEETEDGFETPDPLKEIDAKDPRINFLYKEIIELSLKFLKDPSKNREFGAFAIATTPEKFLEMKKNLREFWDSQFRALETPKGEGSMVASFSFQFFNLADIHE